MTPQTASSIPVFQTASALAARSDLHLGEIDASMEENLAGEHDLHYNDLKSSDPLAMDTLSSMMSRSVGYVSVILPTQCSR